MPREQWPELIRAFGSAKEFRVAGVHVTDIMRALRPAGGVHTTDTTVLPVLHHLHVEEPMPSGGLLQDAVKLFITSRLLSGRPVELNAADRLHNVTDAVSHLDTMKIQFYDKPDVYNNFLDIMKDFNSQM